MSTPAAGVAPMQKQRFHEIDLLKAVSILTVILIHSFRPPWDPNAHSFEIWLGHATSFAVPAFVAASGFLWAGDSAERAAVSLARRLRRLIAPYLCVSLAVQASRALVGRGLSIDEMLYDLALASTYDLYYYIFVAVLFALVAPLYARIPRRTLAAVTPLLVGGTLVSQGLIALGSEYTLSVSAYLRNPFLFAGYFAIGWLARGRYADLRAWIDTQRSWLTPLLATSTLVCLAIVAAPLPIQATMAGHWEYHYVMIALLFVVGCAGIWSGTPIRTLSDATYAIFLIHPIFISIVDRTLAITESGISPLAVGLRFAGGFLGSVIVVYLARRVAPRLSRDLIGA